MTNLLWSLMGAITVGLFAFFAVYSLFVSEWPWRERLGNFIGGLFWTGMSWLFWFGGDIVRATLHRVPDFRTLSNSLGRFVRHWL